MPIVWLETGVASNVRFIECAYVYSCCLAQALSGNSVDKNARCPGILGQI